MAQLYYKTSTGALVPTGGYVINDTTKVSLSGNETVAGEKTFTGSTLISNILTLNATGNASEDVLKIKNNSSYNSSLFIQRPVSANSASLKLGDTADKIEGVVSVNNGGMGISYRSDGSQTSAGISFYSSDTLGSNVGTTDIGIRAKLVEIQATTLKANGDITIDKASPVLRIDASSGTSAIVVDGPAGTSRRTSYRSADSERWIVHVSATAEGGSNAGSDFIFNRRDDSGGSLGDSLTLWRSSGKVTIGSVGSNAGLEFGSSGPRIMSGTGSPEGAVTAPIGSVWINTSDGVRYDKISGTGNTRWSTATLPIGMITPFAGSTAPTGWLLCYGQAVSRTTYANLFAVISTTYGTGDGSTTFNLPDLRGRAVAGLDNMGGTDATRLDADWDNALGETGGTQKHTLTHQESGVPAHGHGHTLGTGEDTPDHSHQQNQYRGSSEPGIGGAGGWLWHEGAGGQYTYGANTRHTHPVTGGISNNTAANASAAHNNMQPTMLLNWIIKT
jgi:microcystin-dependent protein